MNREKQSASQKQASAVIALGKKYARIAYPNPQRQGCPAASKLRAMAYRDHRYNLADLPISHVVMCSPCFSQYLRFRRRLMLVTGAKITTACFALLVGIFASPKLVRHHTAKPLQPHMVENPAPQSPTPGLRQVPLASTPLAIDVNLQSFSPLRGDSPQDVPQKVYLPPTVLRVRFVLPIGMEPGRYTVRLADAQGRSVLEEPITARITGHAASFVMELDLSKSSVGTQMTIMIKPPGLSWREYPMMVH
jgi:hypothetical protein